MARSRRLGLPGSSKTEPLPLTPTTRSKIPGWLVSSKTPLRTQTTWLRTPGPLVLLKIEDPQCDYGFEEFRTICIFLRLAKLLSPKWDGTLGVLREGGERTLSDLRNTWLHCIVSLSARVSEGIVYRTCLDWRKSRAILYVLHSLLSIALRYVSNRGIDF